MIDLIKEAEGYAIDEVEGINTPITMYRENLVDAAKYDFIAGANSKYVKSEKIKAQIEVLSNLQLHFDISKNDAVKRCETAINELEQQLNQLENGQN